MNQTFKLFVVGIVFTICLAGATALYLWNVAGSLSPSPRAQANMNTGVPIDGNTDTRSDPARQQSSPTLAVTGTSRTEVLLTNANPTETPTPSTLADYVQASDGIAEVQVTSVYSWGAEVRVQRWLKIITPPAWKGSSRTINQPFLHLDIESYPSVQLGGYYILLLQRERVEAECSPTVYSTFSGSKGIFEIKDGKIAQSGLPAYNGMAVAEFEALLAKQAPTLAQPTVMPDTGQEDLVQLVHSSDLILETTSGSGDAAMGNVYLSYRVEKVLKKRSDISFPQIAPGGYVGLRYMACTNQPDDPYIRQYILFIQGYNEAYPRDALGFFGIDSDNMITRGAFTYPKAATGQLSTSDSLNHFAGWPLTKVETAIMDSMQAPYTPQATPLKAYP